MSEVIKIKDTFLAFSTQKIDQIHKIVNSNTNPKLCIQMTTKGPSRKQIIISMSSDNINKFMKNSSLYVANINQFLRNSKFEVLVDFICSDLTSIHQADSNLCLFWKHRFNQEWHIKKYNEIHENRSKSIRLAVNNTTQWIVTSWNFSLKTFRKTN